MIQRVFELGMALALALPVLALAQAPPASETTVRPKAELNNNPNHCVHARKTFGQGSDIDAKKPLGKNLSQELAQSNGIICPPPHIDQGMKKPVPQIGTIMPVIPPPNPHVQTK